MGKGFVGAGLAVALTTTLSTMSIAAEDVTSPEGLEWALVGYTAGGGLTQVPAGIEASLLLEDGTASGSGGCNQFSGGYQLVDTSLAFDETRSRTAGACDAAADDVEDAYLSTLLDVTAWAIDGSRLQLSDDSGEVVLSFDPPGGTVTAAQVDALLARLDELESDIAAVDERVDNVRIGRLRERISALEEDNEALSAQLADLRRRLGSGSSSAFNAAEKVLLEGVPDRISSRCRPLRSRLPSGTAAAVQCSPNTSLVTEMAYYLLDRGKAVALYDAKMREQGLAPLPDVAPEGISGCWEGTPAYDYAPGGYIGGVGCYVQGGDANLRIIQEATDCKQLTVGGKRLKRPVMYVALTGAGNDIERLYEWAMRGRPDSLISGLVVPIERPDGRPSPTCGS